MNSNPSRVSAWRPNPPKGKRVSSLLGGGASLSIGLRRGVTHKGKPGPKTLLGGVLNPRAPGCAGGAACGFSPPLSPAAWSGARGTRRLLPVLRDSHRIGQGQVGSFEQTPPPSAPRAGVRLSPLGSDFHSGPELFIQPQYCFSLRAFSRPQPRESWTCQSSRPGIRLSALIFRRSIKRISESFSSGGGEWEHRK